MNPEAISTRPKSEIVQLLQGAAQFLIEDAVCRQDHLAHNGRRAYVWPILKWLAEHTDDAEVWCDAARTSGREIMSEVRQNSEGVWFIYPGLEDPYNFSTNAIDCGIFVDSAHDLFDLAPDEAEGWQEPVRKVALSYNARKIGGDRFIPNQILWCATGLARWIAAHPDHDDAERLRSLLQNTVEDLLSLNGEDGSAPLLTTPGSPWLAGPATYYHGRCIAFSLYILDLIDAHNPELTEKFSIAAGFLLRMMQPDGRKQLAIETKRFYFSGDTEVGSHPHDIYVYWRMYAESGEDVWRSAAGLCLRRLIDVQDDTGAIHSRMEHSITDWQCHTMRTGHLAWLARVPVDFLNAALEHAPLRFVSSPEHLTPPASASIVVTGGAAGWTHVIARKSPLIGWAGQRTSGLVAARTANINDLSQRMGLSYRRRGRPFKFLAEHSKDVFLSLKHAVIHSRFLAFRRRDFRLAWRFFRDEFLFYSVIAIFSRRTEFVLDLAEFEYSRDRISHRLDVANVRGGHIETIGNREISWTEDTISVTDTLTGKGRYRVYVPDPWRAEQHEGAGRNVIVRAPCTVSYSALLSDL